MEYVYLAMVYANDCLDDIVVFRTYEAAERFKKEKDHFHPCCEIKVRIIRQEIQ